jgi:hypothetical protein
MTSAHTTPVSIAPEELDDEIRPEDFALRVAERPLQPAQKLMLALLDLNFGDLAGTDPRLRGEASEWFFGAEQNAGGLDLEAVCDALDLEPADIRRLARRGFVPNAHRASLLRLWAERRRARQESGGAPLLAA